MKVAIVGCGIGGMTAALFFARVGHSVSLFERFDKPLPLGSGLVIQPVGQAVLDRLGLLERALEFGHPITSMFGVEVETGVKVLDADYDTTGGGRFGLAIHRTALFDVLYEAVCASAIAIETSAEIMDVSAGPGRVLTCLDGRNFGPFDLVVDAAGARSCLSPIVGKSLTYGALWGTAEWVNQETPPPMLTQRYVGAHKMLGLLPVGGIPGKQGQFVTVFWSLPVKRYEAWQETPLADWRDEARTLWPEFADLLDQFSDHDQLAMAEYRHGMMRKVIGDGIAHIGDAAHLASPQLGQGANMALLDAWILADAIARDGLANGLLTYQRARRFHVAIYQMISNIFTPLYQSDSTMFPLVRDYFLSPLSRIGVTRRILSRLVCGDLVPPDFRF